jgi:glutathione S-transferase
MSFLDGELAGRPFMAGDHFSIADITAVVAYQFLKPARIGYPEDLPNLQKWFEAISTRPSVFR